MTQIIERYDVSNDALSFVLAVIHVHDLARNLAGSV